MTESLPIMIRTKAEINDFMTSLDSFRDKDVYMEIYKIMLEGDIKCTKNSNGILYRAVDVYGETLDKLLQFINFIAHSRKILKERADQLNTLRQAHTPETVKVVEPILAEKPAPETNDKDEIQENIGTLKKTRRNNKVLNQMLKDCKTAKAKRVVPSSPQRQPLSITEAIEVKPRRTRKPKK